MHFQHDLIDFVKPRLGLGTQAALTDEVPKVFRDFALGTFGFDIVQPSVDNRVFLSGAFESGWTGVLPLGHGGLEVEWLSHDSFSDSGHVRCVVKRWRVGGRGK